MAIALTPVSSRPDPLREKERTPLISLSNDCAVQASVLANVWDRKSPSRAVEDCGLPFEYADVVDSR